MEAVELENRSEERHWWKRRTRWQFFLNRELDTRLRDRCHSTQVQFAAVAQLEHLPRPHPQHVRKMVRLRPAHPGAGRLHGIHEESPA
jgi:hypothetical protein